MVQTSTRSHTVIMTRVQILEGGGRQRELVPSNFSDDDGELSLYPDPPPPLLNCSKRICALGFVNVLKKHRKSKDFIVSINTYKII